MTTTTNPMNTTNTMLDRWAVIERCRQRLHRIAFRIVGSADDADDLVQEVSLRWLKADLASVYAPEGWLVAVVTRLSIDRVRRVKRERQVYGEARDLGYDIAPGQTVPEPVTEVATEVVEAFRLLRERLSAVDRVAFALREIFACDYGEIARLVDKSEAACRQMIHRARERLRRRRPQLTMRADESPALATHFVRALAAGDRGAVLAALLGDETDALTADGGASRRRAGRVDRTLHWHPVLPNPRAWEADVTAAPAA